MYKVHRLVERRTTLNSRKWENNKTFIYGKYFFVALYIGREYKSFIIRYSQVKYESIYVVMLKRIHRE